MHLLTGILAFILTCFATAVMSFITMAVPIGPWIDVTLVLVGAVLVRICAYRLAPAVQRTTIGLATVAGSLGGCIATAGGFSLATLYFLAPEKFLSLLSQPFLWCAWCAGLVITAAGLGIMIADLLQEQLIEREQLPFPIGQLVHKTLVAQNSNKKSHELLYGGVVASVVSAATLFISFVPRAYTLFSGWCWGVIRLPMILIKPDWLPLLLAIGFVAGHVLVVPLIAGIAIKIGVLIPLQSLVFSRISENDFLFSFCSGIIMYGLLLSFRDGATWLKDVVHGLRRHSFGLQKSENRLCAVWPSIALVCATIIFLSLCGFSLVSQAYLVVFTALSAYQLMYIGGVSGMAPVARYATFIMVPGLWLFGFDAFQVTVLSAYVEICGIVAVDVLFGRRMAHDAHFEQRAVRRYQWLGIFITAAVMGLSFWILFTHFGAGSESLPVQRCLTRALLVNTLKTQAFDYWVFLLGALCGMFLKKISVNPTLVLTGLLLPLDFSLLLICGGCLARMTREPEEWYPFWSGVFATSALLMIGKALVGLK